MFYNGDLDEKKFKIYSEAKVYKPFVRAGVNYRLLNRAELTLSFLYGHIEAADSLTGETDNILRNLSFKSVIAELSLQAEYYLFNLYDRRFMNPYIFAGAGVFHFDPTAELNGQKFKLQPLGTEGQFIGSDVYAKPYKLNQVSFPVGAGISFQLHPSWRLRLDAGVHITLTDHLDDLSTVYPDSALLAATPNGPLAVAFSNRSLLNNISENRTRGNASQKDNFVHVGLTLLYTPGGGDGRKNSGRRAGRKGKHACPAYN